MANFVKETQKNLIILQAVHERARERKDCVKRWAIGYNYNASLMQNVAVLSDIYFLITNLCDAIII